jgi:hypothetical protein
MCNLLTLWVKTFHSGLHGYIQAYYSRFVRLALCIGIALIGNNTQILTAWSQSLIVGIPNADTTPAGEVLLTHESQFSPQKGSAFWNSFTFMTYGVRPNLEVSLSLNNLRSPRPDNLSLLAGYKHVLPLFEKRFPHHQFKFTHGVFVPVSLQGKGVGNWTFAHGSMRLPRFQTRLTAGASLGTHQVFGRDAAMAMVGVEQPLTKKLSFVMDWYSGTHDLAALIPAIQYNLNHSDVAIVGLKIPNNNQSGSLGFIVEITKKIN